MDIPGAPVRLVAYCKPVGVLQGRSCLLQMHPKNANTISSGQYRRWADKSHVAIFFRQRPQALRLPIARISSNTNSGLKIRIVATIQRIKGASLWGLRGARPDVYIATTLSCRAHFAALCSSLKSLRANARALGHALGDKATRVARRGCTALHTGPSRNARRSSVWMKHGWFWAAETGVGALMWGLTMKRTDEGIDRGQ